MHRPLVTRNCCACFCSLSPNDSDGDRGGDGDDRRPAASASATHAFDNLYLTTFVTTLDFNNHYQTTIFRTPKFDNEYRTSFLTSLFFFCNHRKTTSPLRNDSNTTSASFPLSKTLKTEKRCKKTPKHKHMKTQKNTEKAKRKNTHKTTQHNTTQHKTKQNVTEGQKTQKNDRETDSTSTGTHEQRHNNTQGRVAGCGRPAFVLVQRTPSVSLEPTLRASFLLLHFRKTFRGRVCRRLRFAEHFFLFPKKTHQYDGRFSHQCFKTHHRAHDPARRVRGKSWPEEGVHAARSTTNLRPGQGGSALAK